MILSSLNSTKGVVYEEACVYSTIVSIENAVPKGQAIRGEVANGIQGSTTTETLIYARKAKARNEAR